MPAFNKNICPPANNWGIINLVKSNNYINSTIFMHLKEDISDQVLPYLGLKLRFVGVDLAPNEQLETGFGSIDRERNIVRMDKLYNDCEIISAIENLGPLNGTIVVIDMPKSLSIAGRLAQESVKMHAFQLTRPSGEKTLRFEQRGIKLCKTLQEKGILSVMYFNYWSRVNYDMLIPFRSRSPQGCRALQTAIEYQLGLKNLPTNLAPSSVLESLIGAYAGWSLWSGQPAKDYKIYKDDLDNMIMIPIGRPHLRQKPIVKKPYRIRKLSFSNSSSNHSADNSIK